MRVTSSGWIILAAATASLFGCSPDSGGEATGDASAPSAAPAAAQPPAMAAREGNRDAQGSVVADTLVWLATLRGDELTFALQTDLPDVTEAIVSIERTYREEPSDDLYNIDYFSLSGSISDFRQPRTIRIDNERWRQDLEELRSTMARLGEPFTVSGISDEVELGVTIPINQDSPLYERGNANVTGGIWTDESFGRIARAEWSVVFPIDASGVNDTRWADPMNLREGGEFEVSRETPLVPLPDPVDPTAALSEIRYLAVGATFVVLERVTRQGTWYRVRAGTAEAWINAVALIGQEIVER